MSLLALAASLCLAADPGVPAILSPLGVRVTPAQAAGVQASCDVFVADATAAKAKIERLAKRLGGTALAGAQAAISYRFVAAPRLEQVRIASLFAEGLAEAGEPGRFSVSADRAPTNAKLPLEFTVRLGKLEEKLK